MSHQMEQERFEESRQGTLDFKRKKILLGQEKPSSAPMVIQSMETGEKQDTEDNFGSPTPAKISKPPRVVKKLLRYDSFEELPDKYMIIAEFFDRMECSIRLLGLRKKVSSFQNISIQVGMLTKRNFLCNHLAKMKHILPEAVQIEKILTHDESTLCMKPDMKITLIPDVLGEYKCQSASIALQKVFRSRLLDFANKHPEDVDIPEAVLPEPFNQQNCTIMMGVWPVESGCLLRCSHLSPSFGSRFSQEITVSETEKTLLLASPATFQFADADNQVLQHMESPSKNETVSALTTNISSPSKLITSQYPCTDLPSSEKTPLKLVSSPERLVVETPGLPEPKRSMSSPNGCTGTETEMSNNSTTRRTLRFCSPMKTDRTAKQNRATHNCGLQVVITEGICMEGGIKGSASDLDMEQENVGTDEGQKLSPTDLFHIIQRIFRSKNCSSLTKQELVYKILLHRCDITETREVEENLELLEKLVPEWFCGKTVPSGDFLHYIKRTSTPETVLAKLQQTA